MKPFGKHKLISAIKEELFFWEKEFLNTKEAPEAPFRPNLSMVDPLESTVAKAIDNTKKFKTLTDIISKGKGTILTDIISKRKRTIFKGENMKKDEIITFKII